MHSYHSRDTTSSRGAGDRNIAHFAAERDLVLVFVHKKNLPQAEARRRDSWYSSTAGPTPIQTHTAVTTGQYEIGS
jgi:hypothetical protein